MANITKTGILNTDNIQEAFLFNDYIQLEYIESTGTQYIETDYIPTMNITQCICDMSPTTDGDSAFFGNRGNYYLFYRVGQNYFWPTSKCEVIEGTLQLNNIYHIDWNCGVLEVTGTDGVYQKGVRSNNNSSGGHLAIFNFIPIDNRYSHVKLYNFYILEHGVFIKKLIPAKRKSDSVIGLYDIINNQFLTNSGTGTFIAGPEIKNAKIYNNKIIINNFYEY